jgi:hypothetical protein
MQTESTPLLTFCLAHNLFRKPVSIPDQVEDKLFGIMRLRSSDRVHTYSYCRHAYRCASVKATSGRGIAAKLRSGKRDGWSIVLA